jgi:opacity protein-like surface antigen
MAAAAPLSAAGPLIVGGRAGTTLTDSGVAGFAPSAVSSALGQNFTVGPTLGVKLPLGFSVEGDVLYNRRSIGLGLAGFNVLGTYADWWEFPVMAKWRPGNGPIVPVLGAGITGQHISNFGRVPTYLLTGRTDSNALGFVAGAGVEFRLGALRVTPEFRYTRWNSGSLAQSYVDSLTGGRNQVQFLAGFTF